ncbi:MAG: NosD domain-containing protein [Candidatus Heimdallarchaeaceae archaeon]
MNLGFVMRAIRILKKNKATLSILIIFILLFSASFVKSTLPTKISSDHGIDVVNEAIYIESDADFALYGFDGTGTEVDPYQIEGLNIISEEDYAIYIDGVTEYFEIHNNSLKAYKGGIYLSEISPGKASILNNSISHMPSGGVGITIKHANNITIINNDFVNNYLAIECFSSVDVLIEDNYMKYNVYGITLLGSPGAQISNNYFNYTTGDSLEILYSDSSVIQNNHFNKSSRGITLDSSFVMINNNIFYGNRDGMRIKSSRSSITMNNFFYKNNNYAISIDSPSITDRRDNLFYHNYFVANADPSEPQAISAGTNNTWYNPIISEGNYWSDANNIGPYELEGAVDLYPLQENDTDNDGLDDIKEVYIYETDKYNNDTDSDGLLDGEEIYSYFTNPLDDDCDNDNLTDGDEVNLYGTNPLDTDSDGDYLTDFLEIVIYNTDPLNIDSDFDLIDDLWEIENGLNPLFNDASFDNDTDNLINLEEYYFNTDPFNDDTDSDGLLDGEEVKIYNTHPRNRDTDDDHLNDFDEVMIYFCDPNNPDSDGDGLKDGLEVSRYHTNPLSNDTDSDLMPDGWEYFNNLDPLIDDASFDNDSDGLTNLDEYLNRCDPFDEDTDDDGYLDGHEVRVGTDPLNPLIHPVLTEEWRLTIIIGSSVLGLASLTSLFFGIKKRLVK